MNNRNKWKLGFRVSVFFLGFLLCCYPIASSFLDEVKQSETIHTYDNTISELKEEEIELEREKAQSYNDVLYQSKGYMIESENAQILSEDSYHQLLNTADMGMMGSIEIPKINVYLPIYHGVSETVLSNGIGHLEGSSLPIGGTSTRAILTGHRGLPNAKLFTRLDELEENDLFYIHVLDEVLAYQINKIEVIEPDDVEKIEIKAGSDLVSLITCTPYGINTHRLVLTGERVVFEKVQHDSIQKELMSVRELIFLCMPFAFLGFAGINVINNIRKRG